MRNRMSTASLLLLCAFATAAAQPANDTPTPARPPLSVQTPARTQTSTQTQTPAPSPAGAKLSPAEAAKKYEAMLEKAKKGEGEVDYGALRFAFFETPAFSPVSGMMVYRALWEAAGQSDWPGAAKMAEAVLSKNYVDINAHMVAHLAYRQQGDEGRANLHRRWAEGLIASVTSGGDGKTPQTAWHVISTSEEYAVLRSLDLRPAGQALIHADGHSYDAMTVVDPRTRAETRVYFNVDRPFSAYGRK